MAEKKVKKPSTFSAEVLVAFIDKYTDKKYKPGDVIKVDSARFKEMNTGKRRVKRR